MAQLKSIYGAYADNLQVIIDASTNRFKPTWYQRYFGWAPAQQSLTFQSVIGRSRIEAMASIVNRDSETPLRSRQALEKLSGEIPAIKEMFKMTESDYRDFLALQSLPISDTTKRDQILDFLFGDIEKVGNAGHKRLDAMSLEAVSTGEITVTIGNNPDGTILTGPVPLGMPTDNRKDAAVSWNTSATATPLTDIETIVDAAELKGILLEKILLSKTLWAKFKACKQVQDTMQSYFYGPKAGSGNPKTVVTIENVNEWLTAEGLPIMEIVNEVTGIEKDGVISAHRAFNQDNAVFIPSGQLGIIKNALAIEQIRPVDKVTYGTFNRAVISKWSQNEPFGEWTKVELNAFPSVEAIDSIFILKAII